ncbi:MAG: nicotinate (nicotinamide) nucleotide adenylyltransferase [Betaproteobacteria bacterium]|nr:nicotinate (nicotinamide) nucleotide adenylyltransferase [Betaproteobacteria bacterium]
MAVALLGGTFDPVHNAHLAMARAALGALPVQKVIFLPTGKTRYRGPALAPAADRVAMLELALAREPRFEIDRRELDPAASGYTADTLRSFHSQGAPELYFLMGADQLEKLSTWHRPDEVRRLAKLAVFARPGHDAGDPAVAVIPMAPMAVSASDIRSRASRGESLAGLVPAPVENYIRSRGLYR